MNEAKTECETCEKEYPLKEFVAGKRVFKSCSDCRAFLGAARNDNLRKPGGKGYTGKSPERIFVLPTGCLFASAYPEFAYSAYFGPKGLRFLTGPNNHPVVRRHKADKRGEVSWVLG